MTSNFYIEQIRHDINEYNKLMTTELVKKNRAGLKDQITLNNLVDHHSKTTSSLLILKNIIANIEKLDNIKDHNLAEKIAIIKNSFANLDNNIVKVDKQVSDILTSISKNPLGKNND